LGEKPRQLEEIMKHNFLIIAGFLLLMAIVVAMRQPKGQYYSVRDMETTDILNGVSYTASAGKTLESSDSLCILISVPDGDRKYCGLYKITTLGQTGIKLYNNPTVLDSGTPIVRINRDLNRDINTSNVKIFKAPTLSSNGALGFQKKWVGETKQSPFVLKDNSVYYYKIYSDSDNNFVTFEEFWCEHNLK
jgi:hypothetical protein